MQFSFSDAPTGSILFGGVDRSKYKGPLIAAAMATPPGENAVREYAIETTSFNATSPAGITSLMPSNASEVIYTLLDSGSSASSIPPSLLTPLLSYLGATTDPNVGQATVPCNLSTAAATFTFGFGGPNGPKITVPVSDFVTPHDKKTEHLQYADGTPACLLTFSPSDNPQMILGDDFLHSAYAVYDLESKTIALAQSNLDPAKAESDIVEITPGQFGIPGVQSVVPDLPIDQAQYSSQVAAIAASASVAAEHPQKTESNFSGTMTELPPKASVTAQGPIATSVPSLGVVNSTTVAGYSVKPSKSQPASPEFTGGAFSLSVPRTGMLFSVLIGLWIWG